MRRFVSALFVVAAIMAVWLTRSLFPTRSPRRDVPDAASVEITDRVMGTALLVKAWARGLSRVELERAAHAAIEEVRRIDALMTTFDPESELTRINRAPHGEWVEVSPETFEVIRRAVEFGQLSDGAFDVTVMPLVDLWGFGPTRRPDEIPADEAIRAALDLVGYDKIGLDAAGRRVMLPKEGMRIDLGGIAKGYAADRAVAVLKRHGVSGALVEIGGDTMAFGRRPDGQLWRLSVKHPARQWLLTTVEVEDRGVATSGDYHNFLMLDGKRYSHLIDPKTGWPIANDVCSVTIVAPDGTAADALATATSVLGVEKGLQVVDALPGVGAIVVKRLGHDRIEIHESKRLKGTLRYRP